MKKLLFKTIVIFLPFLTFGQEVNKMEITPNGVNGFLVRSFEEKEPKEIYKSIKGWTEYNIKNANYATNSNVENEFISFKINEVGIINFKNKPAWNLDLYVEVRIKPNKVRIDLEIIEIDGINEGTNSLEIVGGGIIMGLYKKNGKPVSGYSETREDLNQALNKFVELIFQSVNGKKDYKKDDW
jgi:hypothetical protein